MERLLPYAGKFAAVYILLYMLFNPLFVHTHFIDGELITHSHPFTTNQHTSCEASIIKILNNSLGITGSDIELTEFNTNLFTPYKSLYVNLYSYHYSYFKPFRGPPFSL